MKALGIKIILLFVFVVPFIWFLTINEPTPEIKGITASEKSSYWLVLHRNLGKEYLYHGIPGNQQESNLIREFEVKTGASWSPTPLPKLVGRDYWLIVDKQSSENPITAPYFMQLDVPVGDDWPYGPIPYTECKDEVTGENIQCDWILPGYFGLHGINGNSDKLTDEDDGSSGCIRHGDEDITYLYNLLDPKNNEIRYYVEEE